MRRSLRFHVLFSLVIAGLISASNAQAKPAQPWPGLKITHQKLKDMKPDELAQTAHIFSEFMIRVEKTHGPKIAAELGFKACLFAQLILPGSQADDSYFTNT